MRIASVLTRIVDFALPPRCPGCGAVVASDHQFCARCWTSLDFLTGNGCALCQIPLSATAGSICGACLDAPPRHDGVRAAVAYGPVARDVALRLKYGRRTGLARTMASLMVRHVDVEGIVVPVPLHRWRLWSRGFNQAVLVGRAIATAAKLELKPNLLVRKRATPSLRGLSARRRKDALRGAFRTTTRIEGARSGWSTTFTPAAQRLTPVRRR